jgi:hypothetical protein
MTPSAADYVLALLAPVMSGMAVALMAAAPPQRPRSQTTALFAAAVEAALCTTFPEGERTELSKSEAIKAVSKHAGGTVARRAADSHSRQRYWCECPDLACSHTRTSRCRSQLAPSSSI